jgi:hypothetical protein
LSLLVNSTVKAFSAASTALAFKMFVALTSQDGKSLHADVETKFNPASPLLLQSTLSHTLHVTAIRTVQ